MRIISQLMAIPGVIAAVKSQVAHWFIAGLGGARGAGVAALAQVFAATSITAVTACDDIAAAYTQACDKATENDRIIVFGSFYTVAAVMQVRERQRTSPARGGVQGNRGP